MSPSPRLVTATVGIAAAALACTSTSPSANAAQGERKLQMYTTAYTWFDNTPRGSSVLSNPSVHQTTGGTGTYADPVTVAVGHSLATGEDVLDYPTGTRMYVPSLRKYLVVEDTCGDGDTPEKRPCHTGYTDDDGKHYPWIDVWIDGGDSTEKNANACASRMTDVHTVIMDPRPDYAVTEGSVMGSGCTVYSDAVVSRQDAQASTYVDKGITTVDAALRSFGWG